ncbi:MAG: ribosome biogenesis GTPase Der [Armatimonadota bacterium]
MLSKVAIVGRPNVGKSTFFNRLMGKRTSIVEGQPEITRDRVHGKATWQNKSFTLIDTGGFLPKDEQDIRKLVAEQTRQAIDEADLILFMVDGREGINSLDREIALLLKKTKKKIILLANKLDSVEDEDKIYEFYELGFDNIFPVSSEHGLNTGDVLDIICDNIEFSATEEFKGITIAIVGCPNVGKSSLFNALLGQKRSIVHNVPGTTRDSINTEIRIGNDLFLFIDTAGLREKRKVVEDIEYYGNLRSIDSARISDVVLLVTDSVEEIRAQDKKIAALINKYGRASIMISNKWDLIEIKSTKDEIAKYKKFYIEKVMEELSFINYSPLIFTSATQQKGTSVIYKLIKEVYEQFTKTIETPKLNRFLQNITSLMPPVSVKGKHFKIYYAYQRGASPPTFVFKCNNPKLATPAYLKFLEKKIREKFDFTGTPIKMILRRSK